MMFEGALGAGAMLEAELRGEAAWIKDWRFRKKAFKVVDVLREKGLEKARIGVVGAAGGPHADVGWVSFTEWTYILEQLPDVTFVDLWRPYAELMSVKSDEELAVFRRAAAIAEVACARFLDAAQPGVAETELYATVQREILRLGARSTTMVLHSGVGFPRAGTPKWQQRAQPPRVLQNGDVVTAGVFPLVGNIEAQAHLTSSVGSMPDEVKRCLDLACESYRVGLQAVRPGIPFGQVAMAMEGPIKRSGAWYLTPLIYSLNPIECVGSACVGVQALPGVERYRDVKTVPARGHDVVLKAGMLLQLSPNACIGRRRAVIGGNVVVTANGAEGLNAIPLEQRG
jgi:Xaa-Pro aminopeptidase